MLLVKRSFSPFEFAISAVTVKNMFVFLWMFRLHALNLFF